jgi:hypothetical protein
LNEIDIDELIEATLDSELLGAAADRQFEEQLHTAEEHRRLIREARERSSERFIALLLRVANRPRCRVSPTQPAKVAA